jgi:hypothetical protein
MDWNRVPAVQEQSPEFKPQSQQKKKKRNVVLDSEMSF